MYFKLQYGHVDVNYHSTTAYGFKNMQTVMSGYRLNVEILKSQNQQYKSSPDVKTSKVNGIQPSDTRCLYADMIGTNGQ